MRLPCGIYYREPHNSCCALAYQLLCECPSAVVRSSSTCCAVSLYTEMRLHFLFYVAIFWSSNELHIDIFLEPLFG